MVYKKDIFASYGVIFSLHYKTKNTRKGVFVLCERAVKRCVNIDKNEEKVRRYTVRQIGIYLTAFIV
jgi:hypothetical protein